jgi:uncharacterized OsmC-like protein
MLSVDKEARIASLTWSAETSSSGMPGRALGRVRTNNFVVDDYGFAPYNGPGEEPGAAELFLSGITACAVLMVERIARTEGVPLEHVRAVMEGSRDPDAQRPGPPTLDSAHLRFEFRGLTTEQAGQLVEAFKGR